MRTLTIILLSLIPCLAQVTGDQKKALAQALYTEEVTRDPEAAAGQYQKIVEAHRQQRAHAATALFRLAEIRRAQGKSEAATTLFQEYLSAFSDLEPQATLARGQLADAGASPAKIPTAPTDDEAKNLQRIKHFAVSAPDVVTDPKELLEAVRKNHLTVIDFLLSQGSDPMKTNALQIATSSGYLDVVKRLIGHNPKIPEVNASQLLFIAYENNRTAVLNFLLDQGFTTEITVDGKKARSLLMVACQRDDRPTIKMLLKRGADIDWIANPALELTVISPLHSAIYFRNYDLANYLIEKGAVVTNTGSFKENSKNITPLHLAATDISPAALKLVERLLERGADPNQRLDGTGIPVAPKAGAPPAPTGTLFLSGVNTALEAASTPEMIRLLVNGGATLDPALLLQKAPNLEVFKCLLDLGADPNAPLLTDDDKHTVFFELINIGRSRSHTAPTRAHLEALKKAGAVIPPHQFENQKPLEAVNYRIRDDVFDLFILPGLSKPDSITIVDAKSRKSVQIAAPASIPGSLPTPLILIAGIKALHLEAPDMSDPFGDGGPSRGPLYQTQINVARASGDFIFDLNAQEVPPALKLGDVLTLTPTVDDKSNESGFPGEARWNLEKTINFTVTMIEKGRKSTVTINGKRLAAGPAGLTQPYINGWELVNRLSSNILPPLEIKLTRATGKITILDNPFREFILLPGDAIEVTRYASADTFDPSKITLFTTGSSFRSIYSLDDQKASVPSLCEFLAVSIPSLPASAHALLGENPDKFAAAQIDATLQAPPAFDLSKIKIIRRNGSTLTEIDLDLEASLKTLPDHPTPRQLRALDPQLERGDLIKIATNPVSQDEEWSSLSPEISAFFEKRLQGSVKINLPDNKRPLPPCRGRRLRST